MRERTIQARPIPPPGRGHSDGDDMTLYLVGAFILVLLLVVLMRKNKNTASKPSTAKTTPKKTGAKRRTSAEIAAETIAKYEAEKEKKLKAK